MVTFIMLFCAIWLAIDVVLWLAEHPGVFWFWTISGLVIGGIVWLSNQNVGPIPLSPEAVWGIIGAFSLFGIWRLIVGALAIMHGKNRKGASTTARGFKDSIGH